MSKVFKTIDPRHITIRSFEANKSFNLSGDTSNSSSISVLEGIKPLCSLYISQRFAKGFLSPRSQLGPTNSQLKLSILVMFVYGMLHVFKTLFSSI